MKFLLTVLMALVLLTIESVLVKYLGLSLVRIDVTVAILAFLALRANTLEGAFSAFAVGYLLDVMSGRPTWLFVFLAVFLFVIGRLAASLVDVRGGFSFALFAMGADALHGLLATFFNWMVSRDGDVMAGTLAELPLQVVLTGVGALLLYPLLKKIDPGGERPQAGVLL